MKVGRNKEERKYITLAHDANEKRVTVYTYYQYAIQFGSDIARLLCFPLAYDGVRKGEFSDIIGGEKNGNYHSTTSGGIYVYTVRIHSYYQGTIFGWNKRITIANNKPNTGDKQ